MHKASLGRKEDEDDSDACPCPVASVVLGKAVHVATEKAVR